MRLDERYPGIDSTQLALDFSGEGRFPASLRDRYSPLRTLEQGPTHALVAACRRSDGREVVVKLLRQISSPELRARFRRESEALTRIDHPGVTRVLEYGDADEVPYLVMARVNAKPLAKVFRKVDATDVMLQVASALEAVHAVGLVHRDVNPNTILVTPTGRAILSDFGIVWMPERERLTVAGWVVGTAGYTAPEVFATLRSSRRADWFAWGVTFYWLLERVLPFRPGQIIRAACGENLAPPKFRRTDPEAPAAGVVRRALAPDPIDRPCSLWSVERLLRRSPPAESLTLPLSTGPGCVPSWLLWLRRFQAWILAPV